MGKLYFVAFGFIYLKNYKWTHRLSSYKIYILLYCLRGIKSKNQIKTSFENIL